MRLRFVPTLAALVTAAALLPSSAFAQTDPAGTSDSSFLVSGIAQGGRPGVGSRPGTGSPGVGFGVKGGYLFSTFSEAGQSFSNNNGWEAGIFFGGNRGGVLGVMGEVLYAKKGAKDSTGTITIDQYYLEIPILLRVNIGSPNRNTGAVVYAIGGPAFDILLKAQQNSIDVKNNFESLDLGIIGGAGVEISRFLIEGRVNWGLRNVLKASGGVSNDLKTRSVAILAGFRFN
jgi:hypothetical protein